MFLQGLLLGLVLAGVVVILGLMAGFLSFINRFPALSAYVSLTWNTMKLGYLVFPESVSVPGLPTQAPTDVKGQRRGENVLLVSAQRV